MTSIHLPASLTDVLHEPQASVDLNEAFFSQIIDWSDPEDPDSDEAEVVGANWFCSDNESLFDLSEIPPPSHMVSQVLSMRIRAPEPLLDDHAAIDDQAPTHLCGSRKRKRRQKHDSTKVSRLDHQRICMLQGAICPCARAVGGKNCLLPFNVGDIFSLRFANRDLSASEEYAKRQACLVHAAQRDKAKCMIPVDGHLVCLTAYSLLFDYNRSSMSRSWSRILRGQGVITARHRRSSATCDIPFQDIRAQQALQWLRAWIDSFAETSPVGLKCQKSINYILVGDMYNEYLKDHASRSISLESNPISEKHFRRVWTYLKNADGIHVRRNANASTKCDICDDLHKRYIDIRATKLEQDGIKQQRIAHINAIMNLRNFYMSDVERAMRDYRFQTIAFDGTNSNTCKCPISWRSQLRDEQAENTYVPQKIQSVLIHGKVLLFYVIPPYVDHGMNLSVSTVLDALEYVDPRTECVRFQFDGELAHGVLMYGKRWLTFSVHVVVAKIKSGGSENVNYGIHILMGLLIESEMLLEVFCNRLPPG